MKYGNMKKGVHNALENKTPTRRTKTNKQLYAEGIDRLMKQLGKAEEHNYIIKELNLKDPTKQRITTEDVDYIYKDAFSEAIINSDYRTKEGKIISEQELIGSSNWQGIVIENLKLTIDSADSEIADVLNEWLSDLLTDFDDEDVAEFLQDLNNQGKLISRKMMYKKEDAISYMSAMTDYLVSSGKMSAQQKKFIDDKYNDRFEEI